MTETVEARWEYIEGSGRQPFRNRGYYTRQYRLVGPTNREEAVAAVQARKAEAWPVESYHLCNGQLQDGSWLVDYSYDCTD